MQHFEVKNDTNAWKGIVVIMDKYKVGLAGEDAAAEYLIKSGYRIISRRHRSGHLETDIIAADDKYILFAEVKTRRAFPGGSHPYGTPGSAVGYKKSANLIAAAEDYLRNHRDEVFGLQPRIDVIEVYADPRADSFRPVRLNHIKNAVRKRRSTEAR